MKILPRMITGLLVIALNACNSAAPTLRPATPSSTPQSNPTSVSIPTTADIADVADIIFVNADIITMDETIPTAQAVAIRGDKILAVGSNEEIDKYRDTHTILIDLAGKTIVPGFIDSHQYRIQKRNDVGVSDAGAIIQTAIQQGWTTLDELYVDQPRVDELRDLDQAGILRVRINAYLPFMEYDANGTKLDDWYEAYQQGQIISPHVRVAGLIGFTDFDNATVLLWKQDELNAFLLKAQKEGWTVALKTVSTHSLEMILKAYEYVETVDPDVVNSRDRLEHALFISLDQIARIKQLGLIPIINLNIPGQLVGEQDIDALISREPQGSYTPWRSLEEAGIPVANGSGWPSYFVNEPSGAPFGSPVHLLYQAVTRVGNLGKQPYDWLLDQTITADQAMHALTINSAYAAFEEDVKGSITPGKLADLVILADDPLHVPSKQINDIQVLMTMIGGKVEWCASGNEAFCPGAAPVPVEEIDPFTGDWSAVDPMDGSNMTLQVSRAHDIYNVVLIDEEASSCGTDAAGQPKFAAEVDATGTVNGNVLSTSVTRIKCLSNPPTSTERSLTIEYTYQSATDTLLDNSQGIVWSRQ